MLFTGEDAFANLSDIVFQGVGDDLGHIGVFFNELGRERGELANEIRYNEELSVTLDTGPDGEDGDAQLSSNKTRDLGGHGLDEEHLCARFFHGKGVFHQRAGGSGGPALGLVPSDLSRALGCESDMADDNNTGVYNGPDTVGNAGHPLRA